MQEVIQCNDFDETAYEGVTVTREKVIENSRRIDLVIKIVRKIYPIEVKIYSEDQEAQCYDYYEKEGDYKCISFERHIMNWITRCINSTELEQIYPVREILIQFRDAIKMLTGKEKGKINMEIKEKITLR